ncbi:DNA-directed RNA polymerase subunit B [Candidatus Woesearchaeota archaeon]|nr:DNA-directed RNA polymerase subunit B [Candidatus Woesearchaeota archaeon]MBW3017908.1 DNA-directed RNA polymerase subunit B [Candidatus Woesearchaeota archaeon]
MAEVYIDSNFVGKVEEPLLFIEQVKAERRVNNLNSELNIRYDQNSDEIHIELNKGRIRRPLIIVENGESKLTLDHIEKLEKGEVNWDDLVKQGVIEYVDASEEENCLIAFYHHELTKAHTHLEIAPFVIFSLATSLVPYANFCLATRAHGGSKGLKQAIGFYSANYPVRIDTDVHLLHYPQVPLVKSLMYDISHEDEHPAGQNVVVAILSYEGYNMDDAIIINKSSVDRGLARSTYFRPYVGEELRYSGGLVDQICIPDKDVKGYKSERDYRFLNEDGIAYIESEVNPDDVLIGKTSPPRFLSGMDEYTLGSSHRRESSTTIRHGERGIVDFVVVTENEEGNKFVQVRVRDQRLPEIGDKFSSRHGQKGVVGMIFPQSDMPFSASGIVPDIIFSPHSIPTRMTISHLIELVGGKVSALNGRPIDGTAFDAEPEEALRQELLSLGFRENGTETLYNGLTGEEFKVKIFIGNQYYLKLKHLVANRMQSRATGPIALLTRQPTEGKAKEGGLRLGEMEKDTFVAHGASLLLKERFDSDKTLIPVCENCGMIATDDKFKNRQYCPNCGENVVISYVEMSYAFKLLLDELKSMTVFPKITLEDQY